MTPAEAAQHLSKPIGINRLTLKNRLVMGPMSVNMPTGDGAPSEQTIAFFEARARGGIGMIIVGGLVGTSRAWEETPFRPILRGDVDDFLPQFRRLADAVHAHGVPIIAEIMAGFGRMGRAAPDRPNISASPMSLHMPQSSTMPAPGGITTPVPEAASVDQIRQIECEMIESAARFHQAGWDGVEVPAHMSYLAASFLSPRSNWRTDEYGGPPENRARMLCNIVSGIRARTGPDFVIGLRITANDYMEDGQGPEGFAAIAKLVEAAGLDYVALSHGCYEAAHRIPDVDRLLIDGGEARIFKAKLSVPILMPGLHDPLAAAAAIANGEADIAMLARQTLADPDYARKACSGESHSIIRCDRGNLCAKRMIFSMPLRCSVNPRTGRESRRPGVLPPAKRLVQAPLEAAILNITSSQKLMGVIGALAKTVKRTRGNDA